MMVCLWLLQLAMREVATAVTGIIYKSKVLGTSINVFCKCQPDEMNYTTNLTSALTGSVCSDTTSAGEIQQAYNNLLTKSPITGSTDRICNILRRLLAQVLVHLLQQ